MFKDDYKFFNFIGIFSSLIGVIILISSVYNGIKIADLIILAPYSPIDTSIYDLAVSKYIDAFFVIGLTALIAGVVILFLINYKRLRNC